MIRVLGGPKRLCDGLTRRDLLQVGSLGVLGAGLGGRVGAAPEASSTAGLPGFGRAKSCIMLFLYGSHSQIETFDPKMSAPVEVRSATKPLLLNHLPMDGSSSLMLFMSPLKITFPQLSGAPV